MLCLSRLIVLMGGGLGCLGDSFELAPMREEKGGVLGSMTPQLPTYSCVSTGGFERRMPLFRYLFDQGKGREGTDSALYGSK